MFSTPRGPPDEVHHGSTRSLEGTRTRQLTRGATRTRSRGLQNVLQDRSRNDVTTDERHAEEGIYKKLITRPQKYGELEAWPETKLAALLPNFKPSKKTDLIPPEASSGQRILWGFCVRKNCSPFLSKFAFLALLSTLCLHFSLQIQ